MARTIEVFPAPCLPVTSNPDAMKLLSEVIFDKTGPVGYLHRQLVDLLDLSTLECSTVCSGSEYHLHLPGMSERERVWQVEFGECLILLLNSQHWGI